MQLRRRKYRRHSKRELPSEDEDEHEVKGDVPLGQRPRQRTSRKIINSLESDEEVE